MTSSWRKARPISCATRPSPAPTCARSLLSSCRARSPFSRRPATREGAIINELFEGDGGELRLEFYCYLGLRDKAPNGPEEQAGRKQFDSEDKGYKSALLSTLNRTCEMLADGTL